MLTNSELTAVFIKQGPAVTAQDFIETSEPVEVKIQTSKVESNRLNGKMNSNTTITDTCKANLEFNVKHTMRSVPVGEKPEYLDLLLVGGFKEDTKTPDQHQIVNDSNLQQGSAMIYVDGWKYSSTDSLISDVNMTLQVGQPATINAKVSGYADSIVPVKEVNPTVTLDHNDPLVVSCATILSYDNVVIPTENIVISVNPDVKNIYTMGGAKGLKKDYIGNYKLEMKVTYPEDKDTFDVQPKALKAEQIKEIKIILNADDLGKPVDGVSTVITASFAQATDIQDASSDSRVNRTVTYRLQDGATPALVIANGKF